MTPSVLKWDEGSQAAYLSLSTTFVSFEGERSLRAKAQYVRECGLGGMILWELGLPWRDAQGACPLLRAVRNGLVGVA